MTGTLLEELVGSKICGGYLLRELISSNEGSAVYLTSYGEDRATLKLIPADEAAHEVPQIEHPHIAWLFASGACDVKGAPFRYFVAEEADENLASVIAGRSLSPDETREMLGPVLEALAFLHERGLAHGRIEPSNILAKGDSVKLSSDTICPVGTAASAEEDMRALGLTIIEVLTGQREPSGIAQLPQPFRDMVEHMLQLNPPSRWTARQAAMRLSGKVSSPVLVADAAPRPAAPVVPAAKKPTPKWVYPAAAAVAIGLLIILVRVAGSSSEPSIAASISSGTTSSNVPSPTAPSPPGAPPVVEKSGEKSVARGVDKGIPNDQKGARKTASATPAATPPANHPTSAGPVGHGWFVVVASYAREADAKQEVRDLSRRFPQFKLGVFPPSSIDAHYVVIIGSGLSEEGAESLRQRAVATGLPRDTYIKKYQSARP